MGGKSPVASSAEQRVALMALAGSRDRGEADRARAVLLTLAGWTGPRIAEAFGVREDTVRLWRSDFGKGGVDALKASIASVPVPVPVPVKSSTALRVVTPLLEEPVADRPNWTIARLRAEIEARDGSGAKFAVEVNWADALRIDHAVSTAFQIAGAVLACFGNLPRLNWFLRMRWSSSMPEIVTLARRNLLKPSIGPILAFTPRWSCSMMLLRYFDDLSLVSVKSPFSSGNSRTARWEAA